MKNTVIDYIQQHNKQHPYVTLKYDTIFASGYPFQIKANIENLKAEVDSSYAARLIADYIEKEDNTFPKFAHKSTFSTIGKPIVIRKSMLKNEFFVIIPNEVISQHTFEEQPPINLIYRFNQKPSMIVNTNNPSSSKQLNRMRWLDIKHNFSITVPKYAVYDLAGGRIISESKGAIFSLTSKELTTGGMNYKITYSNFGTRYENPVARLLQSTMNTAYFKHLKTTIPIAYEELSNVDTYLQSGDNSFNLKLNYSIRPDIYDDNSLDFEVDLEKFEHHNAYGSFSGNSLLKATMDLKNDKIKLDKQAYIALVLNDNWHQKWLRNIDRAFAHIEHKDNHWHDKIKTFLPKLHNYQYATINFRVGYEGKPSFNIANNLGSSTLDYFKLHTDQFAIRINQGPDFGTDLKKLPLNFIINIQNYPRILQISLDYLRGLLDNTNVATNLYSETIQHDLQSLLEGLGHQDKICKLAWTGRSKYAKGIWHLGEHNLPSVQSSLFPIILKKELQKKDLE